MNLIDIIIVIVLFILFIPVILIFIASYIVGIKLIIDDLKKRDKSEIRRNHNF